MRRGDHFASLLCNVDENIMNIIEVWLCHWENRRVCVWSRLLQFMLMSEKCFKLNDH